MKATVEILFLVITESERIAVFYFRYLLMRLKNITWKVHNLPNNNAGESKRRTYNFSGFSFDLVLRGGASTIEKSKELQFFSAILTLDRST
jgi:hypothetical protein